MYRNASHGSKPPAQELAAHSGISGLLLLFRGRLCFGLWLGLCGGRPCGGRPRGGLRSGLGLRLRFALRRSRLRSRRFRVFAFGFLRLGLGFLWLLGLALRSLVTIRQIALLFFL